MRSLVGVYNVLPLRPEMQITMASRSIRQHLPAAIRSTISIQRPIASRRAFHASRANMAVNHVTSTADFKQSLSDNEVVLVDFFATWCPPCKAIAPIVDKLSEQYDKIHFAKVDVEELPEIAQKYAIRAMPTFMVFKRGEKVADMLGANPQQLLQMIRNNQPDE